MLSEGWQFMIDPDDVGLAQRWFDPATARPDWGTRPIGLAWEQSDLQYDGIGWYVRDVGWEGPAAYLFLADADDRATVWVNGREAAVLDASNPSAVLTLDDPDGQVFVAIRVVDEGGFGGVKATPRLGITPAGAMDEARRIDDIDRQSPALPPAPSGDAWTMIGGVDEANEALIGLEGGLSPWATAPSVEVWLRDSETRETINALAGGAFSLIGWAPIVTVTGVQPDGTMTRTTTFYDETDRAIRRRVAVDRPPDSRFDQLIIASRPFRVNRTLTEFCNPVLAGDAHVWLNNAPFLAAATSPESFNAFETHAELVYDLTAGTSTFDFALPAAPGRDLPPSDVDVDDRLTETEAAWATRQATAAISVPDEAVQAALEASLGYLLLASDPNGPHPGPLAHNAIWTRDAAYMGLALLMRGRDDVARNYVNAIFSGQEADGRVPPIQGEAIPWDNNEWDAQGQAIYLALQVYRYTGDETFLREHYPAISRAADYISVLREGTAADTPATRGLLPISLSAEDLADGEQHYYWDNFWALVGLSQAADAADRLGTGDGDRWRAEAAGLQAAIETSLETVMGSPVPYIPASVETLDNPGMARGTTPALHPYPVLNTDDPLLQRSFETYANRWIKPNGGGYLHREGQFWTYGGIELANAYLRLDRGDLVHQILGWTLAHQTLPGAFAWAEQVDPNDFSFSGGDMPHAWMASSLTILIRNMLVLEYARGPADDALTLFQTAPVWWFEGDRGVTTRDLPTLYGPLDLTTSGDLRLEEERWVGTLTLALAGAEPPGGYRWRLPFAPASLTSTNNATVVDGWLIMPAPGEVSLTFE
jgi:hypothetical protein